MLSSISKRVNLKEIDRICTSTNFEIRSLHQPRKSLQKRPTLREARERRLKKALDEVEQKRVVRKVREEEARAEREATPLRKYVKRLLS